MRKLTSILFAVGSIFLIAGIILFALIFAQVINLEIKFAIVKQNINKAIVPVDTNFGIVIPKIDASAKIIPDIDPYDSNIYQQALTKGVAHAKGTSFPDANGNMFLFSHSSVNFYEAIKYNSVFYLLSKLEKNDRIYIFFKDKRYDYSVTEKKTVDATEVSYLSRTAAVQDSAKKTLTLMTCWPPGTTWKRLLVLAESEEQ